MLRIVLAIGLVSLLSGLCTGQTVTASLQGKAEAVPAWNYGAIYVPDDFPTIQDAVNAAANRDIIIVRAGTYYENVEVNGKSLWLRSEQGASATVIEGGPGGQDVPTMRIVSVSYPFILEGFTLTHAASMSGSGLSISSSSGAVIKKNIIRDNFRLSGGDGAGISAYAAHDSLIVDNVITSNAADGSGGGIYISFTEGTTIENNEITLNLCGGSKGGGGILVRDNNSSGAIKIFIVNNVITDNLADQGGGGIKLYETQVRIDGNFICRNIGKTGGGINVWIWSDAEIHNNIIALNTASNGYGGAIAFGDVDTTGVLTNNTITGNVASAYGNGICMWFGTKSVSIANSIVWDNDLAIYDGNLTIDYTCGDYLFYGTGNIVGPPLFVTGPQGDYYLSQILAGQASDSPCLDAGDPASVMIDGTTRTDEIQDSGVIDMGYHYPIQ